MNQLQTDLFEALESSDIKKVKELLKKSPDLEVKNGVDMSALTVAVKNGAVELVELLLEHGALVTNDALGVAGMSALSSPALVLRLQKAYMMQVKPVVDELGDADGLLITSAEKGDLDGIKKALKDGANIDVSDELDATSLRWAIRKGHDDAVKELLNAGTDVNHLSDNGWTPLMEAAASGNQALVDLLVDKGAIVKFKNSEGQSAASVAMEGGHSAISEQLTIED